MAELYIPPPNIAVRLSNLQSKRVLFSRSQEPEFGHYPLGDIYDDQWFHIIPGEGSHEGKFKIKSVFTDKVLFCRDHGDDYVGHIAGDGEYDDNYFVFEPGNGRRAGYFRLKTPSTGTVFISRDNHDPQLTSHPADSDVYDDQYFSFLVEDMELYDIEFRTEQGNLAGTTPMFMGKQTLPNHTSTDQTFTATFTEQEDSEYSFEHTTGLSMTIGTEFSAGVPGIAEAKVSMSATHSQEFKWGQSTKTGKGTQYAFPVKAPAHTSVTAFATINRTKMNVPYVMTLKSKSTGYKVTSEGIFNGVHMYDASCTYAETKL